MALKAHDFNIKPKLRPKLKKLFKKDIVLYSAIMSKMKEIANNPDIDHYKNLRKPLQFLKRVHITRQFVLIFGYHKPENVVEFYDFDHRDKIYKLPFRRQQQRKH